MRRTVLLPALLLAVPFPAAAAGPQVTDPAGDATFVGASLAPASQAGYDITSVRWYADDAAQRVAVTFAAAPEGGGHYVLSWATATCAETTLEWRTGGTYSFLKGCKPRHTRWPKPPVWSGRTLTFSIPRADLPTWLAEGSAIRALRSTAAPMADLVRAELHPVADEAYADVKYVVGS